MWAVGWAILTYRPPHTFSVAIGIAAPHVLRSHAVSGLVSGLVSGPGCDYKLVGLQTKDHNARERGLLLVHKSWGCVIQARQHGKLKLHISTHTRTGATAGESNRPQVST